MMIPLHFNTLLRYYRVAAGYSQEALAMAAGLSPRAIRYLESGQRQPYPDTLRRLADALSLTAQQRDTLVAAARRQSKIAEAAISPSIAMPAVTATFRSPQLHAPLVGRERELSLFDHYLAGDGPLLLLLTGEPGIGKSRLLAEMAQHAQAAGWCVLQGCCSRDNPEPYAPLRGALEQHLARLTISQRRASLKGCVWLVRLLPELAAMCESTPARTLLPEQEQCLVFGAVARVLANVAGSAGTLLVLDDLQWARAEALHLLVNLGRFATDVPLRVVGAYRNTDVRSQIEDPLTILLADLLRKGQIMQLPIGPISLDAARELLMQLLTDANFACLPANREALIERLVQRTEGVPCFLIGYAYELQARVLSKQDQDWHTWSECVPWSVAEIIRQRVAALPEVGQELLGIAAVVGQVAPLAVLLAVAAAIGLSLREMLCGLEMVCKAYLLQEADSCTYRFVHNLIREVVLADLSTVRRALLHRLVSRATEQERRRHLKHAPAIADRR